MQTLEADECKADREYSGEALNQGGARRARRETAALTCLVTARRGGRRTAV